MGGVEEVLHRNSTVSRKNLSERWGSLYLLTCACTPEDLFRAFSVINTNRKNNPLKGNRQYDLSILDNLGRAEY